ncbi:MAG: hypothetical protein B7Y89_10745 [Novosphingobium sp. 32-60-15]|nr:MAG: hypothetical protein B7Y89_10745 [Novosphingobium sp. 32-60-15]
MGLGCQTTNYLVEGVRTFGNFTHMFDCRRNEGPSFSFTDFYGALYGNPAPDYFLEGVFGVHLLLLRPARGYGLSSQMFE